MRSEFARGGAVLAIVAAALLVAACASTDEAAKNGATVAFRSDARLTEIEPVCGFSGLRLPEDFTVLATGAYSGRRLRFHIDKSNHAATQIDVVVNHKAKPVVLMLGAYEPTIWNIGWTRGTQLVAVLVSGYHRQVVAGLDPAVPLLNSSYDNRGACGFYYVAESELPKLNPLARRLFGKPVDLVYYAREGIVVLGERIRSDGEVVTSPAVPPESFQSK